MPITVCNYEDVSATTFLLSMLHDWSSQNVSAFVQQLIQRGVSDDWLKDPSQWESKIEEIKAEIPKGLEIASPRTQLNICIWYHQIWSIVPPFIVSLGTLGNVLAFIVMLRCRLVKLSTYFYLAVLALVDQFILMTGLFQRWFSHWSGVSLESHNSATCSFFVYSATSSSYLSTWLIVLVTMERFIVVLYPLRARRLLSFQRAIRMVCALALVCFLIPSHFIISMTTRPRTNYSLHPYECDFKKAFETFSKFWTIIDAVFYSYLPFALICLFNVVTCYKLRQASKNRRLLVGESKGYSSSGGQTAAAVATSSSSSQPLQSLRTKPRSNSVPMQAASSVVGGVMESRDCNVRSQHHRSGGGGGLQKQHSQHAHQPQHESHSTTQLTVMLLLLSLLFLLTTMPIVVTKTLSRVLDLSHYSEWHNALFSLIDLVCEMLMHLNHAMNFYLYCAAGSQFRHNLLVLFHCRRPTGLSSRRSERSEFMTTIRK